MGTLTMLRTTVHPMATMVRIGSRGAYSSEPDRGSMALTASTATSTIATIHVTATQDRCRAGVRSPSIISRVTRRVMGKATLATQATHRAESTAPDLRG